MATQEREIVRAEGDADPRLRKNGAVYARPGTGSCGHTQATEIAIVEQLWSDYPPDDVDQKP